MQTATTKQKLKGNGRAVAKKTAMPEPLRFDRVYSTKNYDQFKVIGGNRSIRESWVLELAEKIEAHDFRIPIEVTPKMEVIDGQHRIEARRLLGIDVPYIVIDAKSLADVQAVNNDRKSWTNLDYLESFVVRGNEHYRKLKWFMQTYKLPLNVSIALLTTGIDSTHNGHRTEAFRAGQFEIKQLDTAVSVASKLSSLDGIFAHWKNSRFTTVIVHLLRNPSFDWMRFERKVKNRPEMLKLCATQGEYFEVIERLYNWHENEENKVHLRPL